MLFRSSILLITSLLTLNSFASVKAQIDLDSSDALTSVFSLSAVDCSPQHVIVLRDISKQSCPLVRVIKGHECRVNRRAARAELKQCTSEVVNEPKDESEERTVEESSVESENEESSQAVSAPLASNQPAADEFESNQSTCSPQQVILLRDVANQSCPAIRVLAGHRCRNNRRKARQQLKACLGSSTFTATDAESEDEETNVQPIDQSSDEFDSSASTPPSDDELASSPIDEFAINQSRRCSPSQIELYTRLANRDCPWIIRPFARRECKADVERGRNLLNQCR